MGRALSLLACLLVGLLVGLWLSVERRAVSAGEATPALVAEAAFLPSESAGHARAPEAAPLDQPAASARAFLAEYYGERWPEIQARMEAKGAKLDVPYTPHSWEEVEPEFRQQAVLEEAARARLLKDRAYWTDELSNERLRGAFQESGSFELDESQLAELEQVIAPDMFEYETTGQAYCDQLDLHIRAAWEQGRYLRAPFTTVGLSDKFGFYSAAMGGNGWSVVLTLEQDDYPDLLALQEEMQASVQRRDRLVHQFLRAHARN